MKPDFNEIAKLVKQVKTQDSTAFAMLYEMTYQRLYFLAFSILKNEEDAKDAIQESYIKIYTNIHSLQDDKLFLAWANKIVYYISLRMNSKKTSGTVDDNILQNLPDDNSEHDPVGAALKSEKKRALAELINKLSPELQATLLFKYYEDLKIHQIAKIMDCPSGTVKSRLNTAKKQLKKAISKGSQANLLFGVFPFIPLRQYFTYYAAQSGMDPSMAYDTLIQSFALSGLGTAARFRPRLPAASAWNYTPISIGGTAAAGIAAVALGTTVLSAPTVKNLSIVNPPEHYTNENVVISAVIMPPLPMISEVYAKDASGRRIPVTVSEDGMADFTVSHNDVYNVYAVSKNGKTTAEQITVDCIDKTSPTVTGYNSSDTEVVISVSDDLSGIDYDNIYGETEGAKRKPPISADRNTGTVIFSYPEKPFRLFISDLTGNVSTYRVRTAE